MARLEAKTKPYTQSGGILENRTKALQNTLSSVDSQRETLASRLSKLESRLFAQFNAMDALVSQMSSTSRSEETRLNSSHVRISYAVFCLKKKNTRCLYLPPTPM